MALLSASGGCAAAIYDIILSGWLAGKTKVGIFYVWYIVTCCGCRDLIKLLNPTIQVIQ